MGSRKKIVLVAKERMMAHLTDHARIGWMQTLAPIRRCGDLV